jgi:hypothetical protein
LFILTLSSINSIFAQDSTNFIVNTNVIWSGMTTSDPFDPSWAHSYYIRFREDTIIDNKLYTKVWESEDSLATDWRLRGLIKEENRKVFYRGLNHAEDLLQYDFSLKKNDTLTVTYADYNMPIKMKVENVDTVSVNGIMRHRISLVDLHNRVRDTWIEKIGSMKGILKSCFYAAGGIPYLLCVYENMNKIYGNTLYPNCYYTEKSINNAVQVSLHQKMSVYPNPVLGELFVQPSSANDESYTLEMFSVKGELVKTECLEAGSNLYRINTGSLRNGIYFLRLISDSGKYDEKVIVKE